MENKSKRKRAYEKDILDNWGPQREKGKKNFIVKFGILTWGTSTFLLYWLLLTLINWLTKSNTPFVLTQMLISYALFLVFGVAYGLILWQRNEKIYLKKFPYKK